MFFPWIASPLFADRLCYYGAATIGGNSLDDTLSPRYLVTFGQWKHFSVANLAALSEYFRVRAGAKSLDGT